MTSGFEKFHGDTFKDDVPVSSGEEGVEIFGTLKLGGRDTIIEVWSDRHLGRGASIEGWFDLVLHKNQRVEGDDPILLHNALIVGGGAFQRELGKWHTKIYPNLIIYDADRLGPDNSIRSVIFSFEHLEKFLNYRDAESYHIDDLNAEDVSSFLEQARAVAAENQGLEVAEGRAVSEPQNDPRFVQIVHSRPSDLKFRVANYDYEITGGTNVFIGYGSAGGKVHNDIKIDFPEPKSIAQTIEAIENCIRFFNQVAFERLDLKRVSAQGGDQGERAWAEFYMPNHVRSLPKQSASEMSAYHAPFCLWEERQSLVSFISTWLSLDDDRREFRRRVNASLGGDTNLDSLSQIGSLCAAIDSLPELKERSKIKRDVLSVMASAAKEAAKRHNVSIEEIRLKGVLGSLNHTRLHRKIERVFETACPTMEKEALQEIIKQITRLRQSAAHGVTASDEMQPYAFPISQVLSAACVIYDLATCASHLSGFEDSRLIARKALQHGLHRVKRLLGEGEEHASTS